MSDALSLHNVSGSLSLQLYGGPSDSSVKESRGQFDYTQRPSVKSLISRFDTLSDARKVESSGTSKAKNVPLVPLNKVDQLAKDGKWAAVWKNFSTQNTGYFIGAKIVGTIIAVVSFLLSPLIKPLVFALTGEWGSLKDLMAPKPMPLQLRLDTAEDRQKTVEKLTIIDEAAELYAGLHDEAGANASNMELKGYKNVGKLLADPSLMGIQEDMPRELAELQPKLLGLSNALKACGGFTLSADGVIENRSSGFKATLHWSEKTKDLHFSIVGSATDLKNDKQRVFATWAANFSQGFGGMPQVYRDADFLTYAICHQLGPDYSKKHFVVSGHSLGGGLASYAFSKNCQNMKQGVAFNPASVSTFAVKKFRFDRPPANVLIHENLTTVTVKGEMVHDVVEKPGKRLNAAYHLGQALDLNIRKHAPKEGVGIHMGKKIKNPISDAIDLHNMKPVYFAMQDILAQARLGEVSPFVAVAA